MHTPSKYWPSTSSKSLASPPSSPIALVDDYAHRLDTAMVDLPASPNELPSMVSGNITQSVIDYLVDQVCETVNFGLGRPTFLLAGVKHSRQKHPDKTDTDRAAFASFVTTVFRRAEVTLSTVIGALVYTVRARPHLSIAIEEWAQHRVLLGALITASKFLNDDSLKNAQWALCTGVFGRRDIQRIEREFLEVLDWELGITESELIRVCSSMVSAGALLRPAVKNIESVSARKDVRMELYEPSEKKVDRTLRTVHARWEEEEWAQHNLIQRLQRPELQAEADTNLDVDGHAEEQAQYCRGIFTSPVSSDSSSTRTAASSPDTDKGYAILHVPPPFHHTSQILNTVPKITSKPVTQPTQTKSAPKGNNFQPPTVPNASPAVLGPLRCINSKILKRLVHLDLTGHVAFQESKLVGCGGYGDICTDECEFADRGKVKVAVKRLRFHIGDNIRLLFEKEIYVWAKLNHPNILPLLGYSFEPSGYPLLVSEWMEKGSAWSFVNSHPRCDLLRLITGIANGLAYLHRKGIVHSDIKSDNIVVSESGDARICDFGCSRMINSSLSLAKITTGIKGTAQYHAYELLALSAKHSKLSDVWAFGMTVYELYTLKRPYAPLSQPQVIAAILQHKLPVFPSSRPSVSNCNHSVILQDICTKCWAFNPNERASMAQLLQILQEHQLDSL